MLAYLKYIKFKKQLRIMTYPTFSLGPVTVTWHMDGSVDQFSYNNEPYIEAVNNALQTPIQIGPNGMILPTQLSQIVDDVLESIVSLPNDRQKIFLADKVFGFQLQMRIPNPKLKLLLFEAILRKVWNWEDTHDEVHKGTLYYFIAKAYLEQGDVPSAYIYFFSAIEEDKSNFPFIGKNPKHGGAYLTTSLVDDPQNRPELFNAVVVPLRNYLQTFIDGYNSRTGTTGITLQDLDRKFLQVDSMEDPKRFFVATTHEIYHLAPLNNSRLVQNDFSKLKIIDSLFNLSLIIDQILESRFLGNVTDRRRKNMANGVWELAKHLNWLNANTNNDAGQFVGRVQPQLNNITPDQIVPSLLDGASRFNNHNITEQQMSIFLAYHLRNFAGHNIEGQNILVTRYNEVLNAVMDAFLTAIEIL